VAAAVVPPRTDQPAASGASGWRERFVTAQDGLSLYVRDYPGPSGSHRTPVLCLTGLTRNSRDYEPLAAHLSADRRVICTDYRGRGRSDYDPVWQHYQPPTYVGDVGAILTALNLHRVIVVGTSLGGLVGMGLGLARPTALAGVVLNDVGPVLGLAGLGKIIAYLSDLSPLPDRQAALQRVRSMVDREDPPAEVLERAVDTTFRQDSQGRYRFDWDANLLKPIRKAKAPPPPLWPLYGGLRRIPVLVIRGEHSTLLTEDTLAAMQADRPDLESVTVPGVGHPPTLVEREAVAAIDRFLDHTG